MPAIPKEAVGAVLAAFVAGVVSVVGLIVAKEQKISEFRQAWIDGLRTDFGLTITNLIAIRALRKENLGEKPKWAVCKDHWLAINQGITCIRLRLNPHDAISIEVLDSLVNLEKLYESSIVKDSEKIIPAIEDLTEKCGLLMKQEWNRVRSGEAAYRKTKAISLVVATFCLILGVALSIASKPPKESDLQSDSPRSVNIYQATPAENATSRALSKPSSSRQGQVKHTTKFKRPSGR